MDHFLFRGLEKKFQGTKPRLGPHLLSMNLCIFDNIVDRDKNARENYCETDRATDATDCYAGDRGCGTQDQVPRSPPRLGWRFQK